MMIDPTRGTLVILIDHHNALLYYGVDRDSVQSDGSIDGGQESLYRRCLLLYEKVCCHGDGRHCYCFIVFHHLTHLLVLRLT